jgi:hypothetical protein
MSPLRGLGGLLRFVGRGGVGRQVRGIRARCGGGADPRRAGNPPPELSPYSALDSVVTSVLAATASLQIRIKAV